ncbi:MAG: hypothetical protein RIM84_26120 [Alphaproteobacteria bacterium]
MATLHERIVDGNELAGEDKIAVRTFAAALYYWAAGTHTRAQVIAAFAVTAEQETALDWLAARFAAASSNEIFLVLLEKAMILAEAGLGGWDDEATFVSRINALSV